MYCIFLIAITYFILLWESCWNTGRQYGTKMLTSIFFIKAIGIINVASKCYNRYPEFMVKYNVNLNKYQHRGICQFWFYGAYFIKKANTLKKNHILLNNSWLLNIVVSSFCFSIVYYVFLVHAVVYIPLSGCCW